MTNKTKNIISLHKSGFSTMEIAKLCEMKKNSVIKLLQYWKALKPSPGVSIEKDVFNFFDKKKVEVEKMKGDHFCDLVVDGANVDVKSAHLTIKNKKTGNCAYHFAIRHKEKLNKDLSEIDYFIFVFLDITKTPMYKLDSKFVKVKRMLFFPSNPETSHKYPIEFIGNLH